MLQLYSVSKDDTRIAALLYPERNYWRPKTRGDCSNLQRPCPYVACRHNLYLDPSTRSTHSILMNFPGVEVWDLVQSCSLDIAEEGGLTLEQVGRILGVSRERIRQMEERALNKMRAKTIETYGEEAWPALLQQLAHGHPA